MGTVALAEKLCPDCGKPMVSNEEFIWKCPTGCGEWFGNEEEEKAPPVKNEKRFQPLTEGLCAMHWRTSEKPVLPPGPAEIKGGSKSKFKKRKKAFKPLPVDRYILA